jgi:hypothetical protein
MASAFYVSQYPRGASVRSSQLDPVAALAVILTVLLPFPAAAQSPATSQTAPLDYPAAAREVMEHIHKTFYLPDQGLYAHSLKQRHPDYMWGNGVMFTALLGAARHEPKSYRPQLAMFFKAMDRYWDAKVKIPGYEPSPTRGGGNDKYYDDNAWMVIAYVEAFEMTQDRRYLQRAEQTLRFVLSGWDDERGGGIWWHEGHKAGSKNTCANAPAAVGCLVIAKHLPPAKATASVDTARKIVDWTTTTLQAKDGLFADSIHVETGKLNGAKLTYNTALMIRAYLGLYRATGEEEFLRQAQRSAKASDWFLSKQRPAYRDPVKWSHLLVEAELELYRETREDYLLQRALRDVEHRYRTWKHSPPESLIDNASIARVLWLAADAQAETNEAAGTR